jgi:hypothetical protein
MVKFSSVLPNTAMSAMSSSAMVTVVAWTLALLSGARAQTGNSATLADCPVCGLGYAIYDGGGTDASEAIA